MFLKGVVLCCLVEAHILAPGTKYLWRSEEILSGDGFFSLALLHQFVNFGQFHHQCQMNHSLLAIDRGPLWKVGNLFILLGMFTKASKLGTPGTRRPQIDQVYQSTFLHHLMDSDGT